MRVTLGRVGTALAAIAAAAVVVACSSSSKSSGPAQGGGASGQKPPSVPMATSVGAGEGALNIIAWAGYAESGQNDPKVDWVHPFEKQTGCKVNVKIGNTSDEMVQLMRTGQYDGVSASGDATLRLIYAGDVAPTNTDLVPNYKTISSFLKNGNWNSVDGQMYGIPHGWGANLLMWNPSAVPGRTDLVERGLRRLVPVCGACHRVRLAHLHRRCCALPDGDSAEPRHQGSVLTDFGAAGRSGCAARKAEGECQ
jgi:putative spermidine/putrescine transport system substrate-binding protein